MPPDDGDLTPLDQMSVGLHEHFLTLVKQGFTEQQALYLVAIVIAELIKGNQS
jgi:hypothetical protein